NRSTAKIKRTPSALPSRWGNCEKGTSTSFGFIKAPVTFVLPGPGDTHSGSILGRLTAREYNAVWDERRGVAPDCPRVSHEVASASKTSLVRERHQVREEHMRRRNAKKAKTNLTRSTGEVPCQDVQLPRAP